MRFLLRALLILGGVGGAFSGAVRAVEVEPSPVGQWDLVIHGQEHGVAHATFFADGSIQGYMVYAPHGNALVRTNSSGFVFTNRFGGVSIDGNWIFQRANRITGYMNLISLTSLGTNGPTTNAMSFAGIARPTRLSLRGYGSFGSVTLKGVPFPETAVDLAAGSYLGTVRVSKVPFPQNEIFSLTGEGTNFYGLGGGGPGYTYEGLMLISSQRYAAIYQARDPGLATPLAAYSGPFNVNKRRGTLLGTDGVRTKVRYSIAAEAP